MKTFFARSLVSCFAALLLAAGAASGRAPVVNVAGATLTVEGANSPYQVTTSDTWDTVLVGNNGVGVLNQSGGTFSITNTSNGLQLAANSAASSGTYNLTGGTLTLPNGLAFIGASGTGSFVQSGTSAVNGSGTDSIYVGYRTGSVGTYSLADAATLNVSNLYVGQASAGNNVYSQSGGTATVSSAVAIGNGPTGRGIFNLSGGTFTTDSFYPGNRGTGVVNQSGGTLFVSGTLGLRMGYSEGSGTYNLSGGTLTTLSVSRGGLGTGALNFNGGTLQAYGFSTTFVSGLQTANVQAGGARIDSNNNTITIPQALAHDAALGATADGGLTKLGAGTLTLSGASTYTGPTTVNAGALVLSPTGTVANTGAVVVNAGGRLTLGAANRINPAASLTLDAASGPGAGATVAFNTGGFSQTLGPVTLNSTSVVDLASGASLLRLGNSVANAWTGTLAIWNYTGTAVTGNGTDEVFFGTNTAGLTAAQLASIRFYSDGGTTPLAAAGYASLTGGEVVPGGLFPGTGLAVPEPATWALLGVGGAGLLGLTRRRR